MRPTDDPSVPAGFEALFRTLTTLTGDGVLLLDAARHIRLLNAPAARMLCAEPQTLIGRAFVYPFSVGVPEEVVLGGDAIEGFPVELSAADVSTAEGPGTLLVIRDLTSRREALQLGRRMERQLRGAHRREMLGALAGGLAHDYNNFLTVILGRSDLLLRGHTGDDELTRHLGLIHMGAKQHALLTRQFLDMVQDEPASPADVDVAAVLRAIAPVLSAALGDAIHVEVSAESELGAARLPVGRLDQILVNLALNARDAMPDGGELRITAEAVDVGEATAGLPVALEPGPYVQICVRDTGPGFPAHVRHRAFEPFFTTKAPRVGGGLGLSIVSGLVAESHGGVWIDETSKAGGAVLFLLRSARRLHAARAMRRPVRSSRDATSILLVEDEPDVRAMVREILERGDYLVLEAEDGEQATRVAAAYGGSLDLVLTDVVMPQMGGADLARALRVGRPDLPVLFMSGYAERDIVRRNLIPEGAAYIQKPFPPADLLEAVAGAFC